MTSLITELSHVFVPLSIIVAVISILGFFGNALAFYVFNFRFPSSGFNVLMAALAMLDMTACAIHMPLDIATFFDIGYLRSYLCKITCFHLAFTATCSALILMSIAVVRFMGIYKPLGSFFSAKSALYVIVISVLISSGLGLPITFLFGDGELITDRNVTTRICAVESRFMSTKGPISYYFILASLYIITFIGHTCLYIKSMAIIWSRRQTFVTLKGKKNVVMLSPASKRNRKRFQPYGNEPSASPASTRSFDARIRSDSHLPGRHGRANGSVEENEIELRPGLDKHQTATLNIRELGASSNPTHGTASPKPLPRSKLANGETMTKTLPESSNVNQNSCRILAVVVAISMAYFLSYAPHFGVMFYLFTHDEAVFTSSAQSLVFELLMRSFFLNNILDPIIYGLLCTDFRQELKQIVFRCVQRNS